MYVNLRNPVAPTSDPKEIATMVHMSLMKGAVRVVPGASTPLSSLRYAMRCMSSAAANELPSNLKLADTDIMTRKPHQPLQELKTDPLQSVRDRTSGGAKAVFQRAGTAGQPLVVNIQRFATKEGDDPDAAPPGPPETLSLSAKVFGQPLRLDILQTVVKWQLACRRRGTASSKRIGDVRGSGKKVRPQKGGGQARAGHKRPPHWRGGAKAHGPKPRDWSYKLNKKERQLGLCVALSAKAAEGNLHVVDSVGQASHKTGLLHRALSLRGWTDSVVLVEAPTATPALAKHRAKMLLKAAAEEGADEAVKEEAEAAAADARFLTACLNLPLVHALPTRGANVYDLLKREKAILTVGAVQQLEQRLLHPIRRKPWDAHSPEYIFHARKKFFK